MWHWRPTRSHSDLYIFHEVANSYEFMRPDSYKCIRYFLNRTYFMSCTIRMNLYEWPTPTPAPKPTHHWCLDKSTSNISQNYPFSLTTNIVSCWVHVCHNLSIVTEQWGYLGCFSTYQQDITSAIFLSDGYIYHLTYHSRQLFSQKKTWC